MSDRPDPVNRKEVEAILQRVHALPRAAQLSLFAELRDYLGAEEVPETEQDQAIRLRSESLEVMSRVAKHYQLPAGKAPTSTQWRSAPAQLTAGWSATRMAQVWGRFRFAQGAFRGEHLTSGAARRSVKRRSVHRRLGFEDELLGVERWLDTKPASQTSQDYDEFVAEQNDAIAQDRLDEKPLRQASYIIERLGVHFEDVVAVVRDGADLGRLRDARMEALLEQTGGALGVIGARAVAAVIGHVGRPAELVDRPEFPAPVVKLGGVRGWLMSDVEAFRDKRTIPQRSEYELQHQVVGTTEMAELRGYPNAASIIAILHRSPRMLPEPDGRLDNAIYWLRTTVEEWLPTAPPRRRSRPVKPRPRAPERGE